MKKYITAAVTVFALFTASCHKYVEIEQKTSKTLKYTSDYQYLLNSTTSFEGSFGYPVLSCDDTGIDNTTYQNTLLTQWGYTYQWAFTRYTDTETDIDWERFYKQIYICNEVTDGVMTSENGTNADKLNILAWAKVQRAYAYLQLVNLYAKPYHSATAETDPGVPLLLTADLFANLKRASVAAVYAQIQKDLTDALPYLPNLPAYKTDPSKAAAYALLAQSALQMRNFTAAGTYADQVLAIQNTLTDLTKFAAAPATLPKRLLDPEIIFSKIAGGTFLPTLSADLLNLLGTTDLRYTLFTGLNSGTKAYGRSYYRQNYTNEPVNVGPGVPEIMLIKAESAARAGDAATAIAVLNSLRKTRFAAADYVALNPTTAEAALSSVIDERRRELFGRGLRWFDQRRLTQEGAFAKTYTRVFKGTTYTLEPNSNRYTYSIANYYLKLNPEIEQNPQ